jgi:hypothetical protein
MGSLIVFESNKFTAKFHEWKKERREDYLKLIIELRRYLAESESELCMK